MKALLPSERIDRAILLIRGHKVILDTDLAHLYGVTTKRLNEQVKRNRNRFPADFMFQLTSKEKAEVVANCDHLTKLKFSPAKPLAFTEHGAVMVASVLNSKRAIEVSIYVVRAFVKVREVLGAHRELAQKLTELERGVDGATCAKIPPHRIQDLRGATKSSFLSPSDRHTLSVIGHLPVFFRHQIWFLHMPALSSGRMTWY